MDRIHFFVPSFIKYQSHQFTNRTNSFPALSVTGRNCSLNCSHCGGKKLLAMTPVMTPEDLFGVAQKLSATGSEGFLLSGGCQTDGKIDFAKFIPSIKRIKERLNLKIFIHTGLVDKDFAKELRKSGVDACLLDIIGAEDTIKEVYGLNAKPADYLQSLRNLGEEKIPIIPHIVIGLHAGEIRGEFEALNIISQCPVSALVLVIFTPLVNTRFEFKPYPSIESVVKVIEKAQELNIRPIVLGCARPFGEVRRLIEKVAIDLGLDGISFPTQETIDYTIRKGKKISFHNVCCADIYNYYKELGQ